MNPATTLYTIGHGSRSLAAFMDVLEAHRIECLIDVRAYPSSKRHPQFRRAMLETALARAGIAYTWEGVALGGMRRPRRDSPHLGLRDAAFRGFADHMASAPFKQALEALIARGQTARAAFMCAETQPAHCHRSFIADVLLGRGIAVLHLVAADDVRPHVLHGAARPAADGLVYDRSVQMPLGY
ncbi:MAG: DUF488 family protein [Burkholderiales bacterium]